MTLELRQVFRLRDGEPGAICLDVELCMSGMSGEEIFLNAVTKGKVIHAGVYLVTRSEDASGRPYLSEGDVFSLWADGSIHDGCCPESPVPSLASWPPRKHSG